MNFAIHQRENVNILIIINNINNKVGEYMLTLDLKQTQAQVLDKKCNGLPQTEVVKLKFDAVTNKFTTLIVVARDEDVRS